MAHGVTQLFGLIPAAGTGARMGTQVPKQYGRLGAKTMLEHAIDALLASVRIDHVLVVVAAGDAAWRSMAERSRVSFAGVGGASRADSVYSGVIALIDTHAAAASDWVLVHDAARPCLAAEELSSLIESLQHDEVGGLLAMPLADTLKRDDNAARVESTIARERLWRAATPQMFRVGMLREALSDPRVRESATDEAAAIEARGQRPRLIEGLATNIKVTRPSDWALAETILRMQGRIG